MNANEILDMMRKNMGSVPVAIEKSVSVATLGLTAGFLFYGIIHHALHHWLARGAWMRQCKRRHAIHHRSPQVNFGVTMPWWDRVFQTNSQ